MPATWGTIKPGWLVLVLLLAYATFATLQWRVAASALREARVEAAAADLDRRDGVRGVAAVDGAGTGAPEADERAVGAGAEPAATMAAATSAGDPGTSTNARDDGLWFPIPGARVPSDDTHLPGAERAYRSGVSQGFTFWEASSGVPITYGTPVVAAAAGTIERVDAAYAELTSVEWDDLVARVEEGADERQLDLLRGRQVWIRLDDGRLLRYGHLAEVRSGLSVGTRVDRGHVLGTVGNSGTGDAVAGRTTNARLHFEVWDGGAFVGQGLPPDEVRAVAATLFVGP